jgi:hypothetical protein
MARQVRVTARLSMLLMVVLSAVLVLQPISAGAADCSAEKAAVDELGKNIAKLTDDIKKQQRDLEAAQRDLANDLALIEKTQRTLQGEVPDVQQELRDKGLSDSLKIAAVQVPLSIAIFAAGPEGWGLLGHELTTLIELLEKAHTALEIYDLVREGGEAQDILDELTSDLGSLDATRTFADEHDLPHLSLMLDHEAALAAQMKAFDRDWARIKFAANAIAGDQALLDKLAQQLAAALEALYACLDQPGPVPSPCEGQATNPNGAGVCR